MLARDKQTRDWLAEAIRGAVDDVVSTHGSRLTQEPQITSKIADRLEQTLKGVSINGYEVKIIASDMPDRGRGALEKRTGVDLFIGIRVRQRETGIEIAKGLLVQGKLDGPPSRKEQDRLLEQCGKMALRWPKAAYVWIYSSGGASSIPASEILAHPNVPPQMLSSRNIAEHFRDVLDCVAGDETLAISEMFESSDALNVIMQEVAARQAVAIDLVPTLL